MSANLEVFVFESLQKICDAAAKTKELKLLQDQSKKLIDQLRGGEFARRVPFDVDVSQQLLAVFKAAFATSNPRLVEPALSCLHKLVAYAYLQGESTNSGRLDDANMVTQAVIMTARCGESSSAPTQLAVIKALLTFVTAEHFLVHGDSLMQAVRTVFNLAIGSGAADMQSTAQSALLQMLNTVLKRVGQQVGSPHYTPQPSPLQQLYKSHMGSVDCEGVAHGLSRGPSDVAQGLSRGQSDVALESRSAAGPRSSDSLAALGEPEAMPVAEGAVAASLSPKQRQAGGGAGAAQGGAGGAGQSPGQAAGSTGDARGVGRVPSREISAALAVELSLPMGEDAGQMAAAATSPGSTAAAQQQQPQQQLESTDYEADRDQETAALLPPGLPRIETRARGGGGGKGGGADGAGSPVDDDARAAQLASLAEQADLRGLERAFDALPQQAAGGGGGQAEGGGAGGAPGGGQPGSARQETPPDPRRALMRDRRAAAWKQLTVVERDAVIVLGAMCKLAARETGFGAMETYMHKGKLLALDLLLRVLSNPMHDWSHVRPVFAAELRQPLCVALLRNCMSPYDQALTAAVKIFGTVLAVPKLRSGMKAELGALYPLLLLRPIESEKPDSAHQVQMAVEGILGVCSSAQVLVDVFVNYDCSLQASNLFERTIKALARVVQLPEATSPFPAAPTTRIKQTALKALLAAVKSLDTWAGPIKSSAAVAAECGADGQGAVEPAGANAALPDSPHRQMLERIAAAKEMKDALQTGIAAFNKNPVKGVKLLIESGTAEGSPEGVAQFLRDHSNRLDKSMVGELFGDHGDFSIQVMHAYIDQERYVGLAIDAALRKLLASFRLPGEAQKIDRIMEKFAERYCRDNPAIFPNADGAYLLAFAIIMLNTDAHNPMADRRIMADDFVSMGMYQTEAGDYKPILPAEDLQSIYRRITESEIKVHEDAVAAGVPVGGAGAGAKAESSRRSKLALAVGLPQMVLPFWSGATWDKQHGVDVERKRLLAITQEMVASGGMTGNMWHMASHAEHARPMLQVSGESVLRCLSTALAAAPSLQPAAPILDAYEQAIQLAALLRLETLCDALLASLAAAASLEAPAPFYSPLEAKQVAALSKLVSLGSCSEAGLLGTSWVTVLRTLSQLERLQAQLMPGAHPTMPFGNGLLGSSPDLTSLPPPPQASSSFGRLLQKMGLGGSGDAGEAGTKLVSGLPIREGPGAGFVLWAETAGATPIERVYSSSASLPGDAVVTFMRALCAVSQEELSPGKHGERPRVHLLQKVVECAYHNMGRIRLVWSRLWTVVAQHLVSAACHTDPYVAMYAVDALRQLVAKLLDRAELARFTYQGDALRPFAAILRHSDSHAVRELAVACVVHAITAHPRGLGSGWRSVIEALTVAAADSFPGVVNQALDALQPVLEALYHPEGIGHSALRECVAAVLAAVHNPHGFEELSVGGVYLFQIVARRLADAISDGVGDEELLPLSSPSVLRYASEQGFASPLRLPHPAGSGAAGDASAAAALSEASPGQLVVQPSAAEAGGEGHVGQGQGDGNAETILWAWQLVLVPLAAAARLDLRPKVADTAAAMLFQILKSHGHVLSPSLWQALYAAAAVHVLALPPDLAAAADAEARAANRDGSGSPLGQGAAASPAAAAGGAAAAARGAVSSEARLGSEVAVQYGTPGATVPSRRTTFDSALGGLSRITSSQGSAGALLAAWCSVSPELSSEGLYRLERHASAHMPDLWALLVEHYGLAAPVLLPQALSLLQQYIGCPSEQLAVLGVNQLYHLVHTAAPILDAQGWQAVVACLEAVCLVDPLQGLGLAGAAAGDAQVSATLADAIRRRCRLLVLLQRVLDLLLQHSAACMPGGAQLQLLGVLRGTVRQAEGFNGGYRGGGGGARAQAAALLAAAAAPAGATQGPTGSQGTPRSSSAGEEASWEVVERPSQPGGPPSQPSTPPIGSAATVAAAAGAGGELGTAAALLPGLARQEVHGGCLLITALQRCSDQPLTSDQTEHIVQSEAEGRLAAYCLEVVEAAAGRIRAVEPPGAAAAAMAARASQALQPWEDTLRSPLVEAALGALAGLGSDAWRRHQPALFQQLSQLVCTPSMAVRRALTQLMRRQLPAAFPELGLGNPAAAAAAP